MNLTLTLNDGQAADVEDWLKGYFDGTSDIFSHEISGSWLCGLFEESSQWLAYDETEVKGNAHSAAISAFRQNVELPKHYYSIDRTLGLRIAACGILHHGWGFIDGSCDASDMDGIVQTVLLGDVIYI